MSADYDDIFAAASLPPDVLALINGDPGDFGEPVEAPAKRIARILSGYGQFVDSPYTDAEAADICRRIPSSSGAARSVSGPLAKLAQYGSLFEYTRFLLHREALRQVERETLAANAESLRIAAEEEAKYGKEPKDFEAAPSGSLPNVAAFLGAGAQHHRYKKGARVRVRNGVLRVQFRSTEQNKTRYPGGFLVLGVSGFQRDNQPLAVLDAAGNLHWALDADKGTLAPMFDLFEDDPRAFVMNHPGDEDNCCFCGKDLVDEVSTALKFGPDCAVRWSLPHTPAAAAVARAKWAEPACVAVA